MLQENNEIESLFAIGTKICGYCKGARSIKNPDGTYSPCRCVYKESFLKYLGDLKKYTSCSESILLEPLKSNTDLVIEFDSSKALYSHIKTALLNRKDLSKSWKIMTPDEIMTRSFADESQKRELYSTDLLIITAVAFPFFEAAGKQHEYVIKTRQAIGRTTWFCTKNLKEFCERTDIKGITKELKDALRSMKRVNIRASETKLINKKNKNISDEALKLGIGLGGVSKELLELETATVE